MTIYEQNLEILEEVRPNLYEALQECKKEENSLQVLVGDALNGEQFLAVLNGEEIVSLSSTYHPAHEAERFITQFKKNWEETNLFLFGFGQVDIVRSIMSEECPIDKCIVYEPSIAIFQKVLEEYDIRDLINDRKLMILVEGLNGDLLEEILYEEINYRNWRFHRFISLSKYKNLFEDSFKNVRKIYDRMIDQHRAEMNTLVTLAQVGMKNEINAFKWMMNCMTLDSLQGIFPKELPYIIVAAGPSLEKNVEVLKQAKGKAFIVCVDTALNFLLERGIVPDMACTVDARKEVSLFSRPEISEIPMLVSTDSNHLALEAIGNFIPIYFSTTNDFAKRLFQDKGKRVDYFDGGGSVATVCFQIGVDLGFQKIILVGQDLAFTGKKAHAGMGDLNEEDLVYNVQLVDGYDGNKIMTRGDFKSYIDWYNLKISTLANQTVINATEGGAKLNGTIQMTLQEVVNTYCTKEHDIKELFDKVSLVWDTLEDKADLYWEIKDKYQYFKSFHRRLKDGIGLTNRAVTLLKRGNYQTRELQDIDRKLNRITEEVAEKEGILILVKRMIETDIEINDDLLDADENLELESIRLYKKMETYLRGLLDALEELLPIWKEVMEEINSKYQFEKV